MYKLEMKRWNRNLHLVMYNLEMKRWNRNLRIPKSYIFTCENITFLYFHM